MRLLNLLKRYWLYSLVWLAGFWVLWLATLPQPIIAHAIPKGRLFIGFVNGGRAYVTAGYSTGEDNTVEFYFGPVLIHDSETGLIKKALFKSDDRFINLLVELNRDCALRSVRKQGENADGSFKYLLEWIDAGTGDNIASFNPVVKAHAPKNQSTWLPAALSPDGRYASYLTLVDNQEKIVCEEIHTGQRIFAADSTGYIRYLGFSPNGRYLQLGRDGGIAILDAAKGREVLNLPGSEERRLFCRWSPDSKLLYTTDRAVWNLEPKQPQVRLPIESDEPRFFSHDSKEVISTLFDDSGVWLIYFYVHTGREFEAKRLLVIPGVIGGSGVSLDSHNGYVLVRGYDLKWNQNSLPNRFTGFTGYALVNLQKNEVIMRGRGNTDGEHLSPDGRFLFVNNLSPDWSWECWNVPQQKTVNTFPYVAAAWLLGCLLLRSVFHFLSLRRRKAPGA